MLTSTEHAEQWSAPPAPLPPAALLGTNRLFGSLTAHLGLGTVNSNIM